MLNSLVSKQVIGAQRLSRTGDRTDKVMLFELDYRGHHPGYVQHLVKYWCNQNFPGQLDVLVSQQFAQHHSNVVGLGSDQKNVRFVTITSQEQEQLFESADLGDSFTGRIQRSFQEWNLLRQYTAQLGTTHCMLMYFDTLLLRLALNSKLSCPFSGIYFRPVFHYSSFANYRPARKEHLWQWRDQVCLRRILNSSKLDTLFCLDPIAVEHINQLDAQSRAMFLPDPVQIYPPSTSQLDELRATLKIQPGRKVFLLFGVLTKRKGIDQVLEAIATLSAAQCQQVCLLLIGPIPKEDREELQARIANLTQSHPVQVVGRHEFVTDEAIQPYFQIADVILTPYQRHIGMSAILVRAAAAQKPVLSSDFGLMGEVTRRYQLGLAVDSEHVQQLAAAIGRFLVEPAEQLCDRQKMQQFAEQNDAAKFASTVFQQIRSQPQSSGV